MNEEMMIDIVTEGLIDQLNDIASEGVIVDATFAFDYIGEELSDAGLEPNAQMILNVTKRVMVALG